MKKKVISFFLALLTVMLCFIGCSNFEYNAVIVKDEYTIKESWLENNYTQDSYQSKYNDKLPKTRTIIVDNQAMLDEIFSNFRKTDFEKEMLIVFCYTSIYVREQKLEKVSFENGVLSVEFNVVKSKPGAGDATAPQTRICVICLDKVEANEIKIKYNGQ